MKNQRAIAASIINDVICKEQHLPTIMQNYRERGIAVDSFVHNLCYNVMRSYFRLTFIVGLLLNKPLKKKDQILHSLLLVGLYQLQEQSNTTSHAAINESVAAVVELNREWAKGLINGILRNYQRKFQELNLRAEQNWSAKYSHPGWIINKIKDAYPNDWQQILLANNQQPPFTLRVNLRKITKDLFCAKLSEAQISHTVSEQLPAAVTLDDSIAVQDIPGFNQGWFAVQDAAAQLALPLLDLASDMKVLDACSAPGGKACHILENYQVELTALDVAESRAKILKENLKRLGLEGFNPQLLVADLLQPNLWWDNQLFDRVLLDAPCSATGVMRRNPDIKLFRKQQQINHIVQVQQQMLDTCWRLLKPGGVLLYATCSVLPEENQRQIASFISKQQDAEPLPIEHFLLSGNDSLGLQILPGERAMDGFFYAKIRKSV